MINGFNIAAVILLVVMLGTGAIVGFTYFRIERWWNDHKSDIALWIGRHIYREDWRATR